MTKATSSQKIRCAIYTRKSSDEGLEQEFNSLDAQYEACQSYIASQKHEGWSLIKQRYDDGGISGGTMERAGLKALLDDVDHGLIDMIVVYKIDRLTRSLSDFSKIVDRLDGARASFVSVTQSFNTSTSMGRLTLNMLLSFAQFEREVTAERIRDKIAASKAKGMWMGGTPPLGYLPHPDKNLRGLIIHYGQAKTVKRLFELYDELHCLAKVKKALSHEQLEFKNTNDNAHIYPSRGAIHKILTNPIYISKIKHKDKIYDGKHEAIITLALWQRVQDKLQLNSAKRRGSQTNSDTLSFFKGKLFDETGDHLTPTHTNKNGTIIRYYISNRLINAKDPTGWRLPASTFETTVITALKASLSEWCEQSSISCKTSIDQHRAQMTKLEHYLQLPNSHIAHAIIRINLEPHQIKITVDAALLSTELSLSQSNNDKELIFTIPMTMRKRGVEQKLIIGHIPTVQLDQPLIKGLIKAHQWLEMLKSGQTYCTIAKAENITESYIRSRISLAFLAPHIQKAIMTGTQPAHLSLEKLIRSKIPLNWKDQ